ncbi:hypothetical protein NHP200010_04490 [Helicobacter bizzozeronii]|uniref:hypothetical protein n=1 Tax=Helicobacter bizzozeronii TaxID=56877 RepID=UPI00244D8244|nr:hypothetical protein [Helicobacter bizzozeronii]GMB92738.1 hypothetical protein NHP200010_04490 [Helicobacter bizzozeronii]
MFGAAKTLYIWCIFWGVEQDYIQSYTAIKERHKLNISSNVIASQAREIAKQKANSHFQVFTDIFEGENLIGFIGNLVGLIGGIALAALTFGAATPIAVAKLATSVTASATTFAISIAQNVIENNAQLAQSYHAQSVESLQRARQSLANMDETQQKRSKSLIFNPYAIFPEGHIYKGENPGSLGYKAGLEGFSPMKGILGTFKENLGAEQLNNRAHRHLAGNADYEPLDLPFPKASIDRSHKRAIQDLKLRLEKRFEDIKKGFAELAGEYFGAFDSSILERLFKEHMRAEIHPLINQINTLDFLDKMQFYSKGERLPLFDRVLFPDVPKLPQSGFGQYGEIKIKGKRVMQEEKNIHYTPEGIYHHIFDFQGIIKDSIIEWAIAKIPKNGRGLYWEFHSKTIYNKGDSIVLLRQFKKGQTLPTKSPAVAQYEAIKDLENPDIPLDKEFELKEAYDGYVKAYWDCFDIEVLGATSKRPLEYAKAQRKDLKDVFFNTTQEPLSALELEKQKMFKEFVIYYKLKQGDMG